ncbi:hypothetical protein OQA88_9983 [Cercophora sp. LCS_1]
MDSNWADRVSKSFVRQHWITNDLTSTHLLTAIDQTAPKIYTRLVYGFPFSGPDENIPAAVDYLHAGLKRAFTRWPYLAGQVIHSDDDPRDTNSHLIELVYTDDASKNNLAKYPDEVFDWQIVEDDEFAWTFERLED